MTLMPSTTTWKLKQLACEGGALLETAEGLMVAHTPRRTLKCEAGPDVWDQLEAFLTECRGPAIGMLAYEMGAFSEPGYPLPFHPSTRPVLCFYEPTIFEPIELPRINQKFVCDPPQSSDSKERYLHKVEQIRDRIAAGEVYQVNLSQQFTFSHRGIDPIQLFTALRQRNPAPHAAYLNCGDFHICSLSPELFIERRGKELVTRPIKGTAPRSDDPHEDQRWREELISSKKDRAELLMITDLMRNDFTRVCEKGSVHVQRLWELEEHRDVFHLVSTVVGKCSAPSVHCVRTLFPAGSITGCPKRAAMKTIYELEGRPRGVYTGAIGLFYPSGDFSLNVAIRTLTMDTEKIEVQLGGAILYDSEAEKEYAETLHKGRTFFELLR